MAISFSGGRSRSIRREPPIMGMQLVNFITCGCESSAPFLSFKKSGANPRRCMKYTIDQKTIHLNHLKWVLFLFGNIDNVRPLKIYKYCILIHAKKPTYLQKILGTILLSGNFLLYVTQSESDNNLSN
jgi:hypothetical protein